MLDGAGEWPRGVGGAENPDRKPESLDVGNGCCFIGMLVAWETWIDNRIQDGRLRCGLRGFDWNLKWDRGV